MIIKGFQPLTLIDYPEKLAAIVFTQGCNFRCPFCYNASLVRDDPTLPLIPTETILAHLKRRKDVLEGLVVTGGEPTIQSDLADFLGKVKSLGYLVKLDSNGSRPEVLKELVDSALIDYLALDVKTVLDEAYLELTGSDSSILEKVKRSLSLVLDGRVLGEMRTTVVPRFHSGETLKKMAQQLKMLGQMGGGSWRWYLQSFQPKDCLDPALNEEDSYEEDWQRKTVETLKELVPQVSWR